MIRDVVKGWTDGGCALRGGDSEYAGALDGTACTADDRTKLENRESRVGLDCDGKTPACTKPDPEGCTSTLADGTTREVGDTTNCVLTRATGVSVEDRGFCVAVNSAVATCAYTIAPTDAEWAAYHECFGQASQTADTREHCIQEWEDTLEPSADCVACIEHVDSIGRGNEMMQLCADPPAAIA